MTTSYRYCWQQDLAGEMLRGAFQRHAAEAVPACCAAVDSMFGLSLRMLLQLGCHLLAAGGLVFALHEDESSKAAVRDAAPFPPGPAALCLTGAMICARNGLTKARLSQTWYSYRHQLGVLGASSPYQRTGAE